MFVSQIRQGQNTPPDYGVTGSIMPKTLHSGVRIGQVRQCLSHAQSLEDDSQYPALPAAYYAKTHRNRHKMRKTASRLLLHVMH